MTRSRSEFEARRVEVPAASVLNAQYREPDLIDAFEIALSDAVIDDPERLARHLDANPAPWFGGLIRLRDMLVKPLGITTTQQFRTDSTTDRNDLISFFRVFDRRKNEIVFGQDDAHLDFRASVLILPSSSTHAGRRLVVTTTVKCHNRLGKAYLAAITPFHRLVVAGGLRQAAAAGWPQSTR